MLPSAGPSQHPASKPSCKPSIQPTAVPSFVPSLEPSRQPSTQPTSQPSSLPSQQPSIRPFSKPSSIPISKPSLKPTSQPSRYPSKQPISIPSGKPSSQPSVQPSQLPTLASKLPTKAPTFPISKGLGATRAPSTAVNTKYTIFYRINIAPFVGNSFDVYQDNWFRKAVIEYFPVSVNYDNIKITVSNGQDNVGNENDDNGESRGGIGEGSQNDPRKNEAFDLTTTDNSAKTRQVIVRVILYQLLKKDDPGVCPKLSSNDKGVPAAVFNGNFLSFLKSSNNLDFIGITTLALASTGQCELNQYSPNIANATAATLPVYISLIYFAGLFIFFALIGLGISSQYSAQLRWATKHAQSIMKTQDENADTRIENGSVTSPTLPMDRLILFAVDSIVNEDSLGFSWSAHFDLLKGQSPMKYSEKQRSNTMNPFRNLLMYDTILKKHSLFYVFYSIAELRSALSTFVHIFQKTMKTGTGKSIQVASHGFRKDPAVRQISIFLLRYLTRVSIVSMIIAILYAFQYPHLLNNSNLKMDCHGLDLDQSSCENASVIFSLNTRHANGAITLVYVILPHTVSVLM